MDGASAAPARGRRLGLHARVILAFGVGAALVSAVLALSTFFVVRSELVSQRMRSVLRQTFVDARLVKVELGAPSTNIGEALSSVTTASGARAFLFRDGLWYSTSATTKGTAVPGVLARAVVRGDAAEQRVELDGVPTAFAGVPIPAIGVAYFEEHPLTDLASTLGLLGTVLTTVALATTTVAALCGWWASRRLMRPIADVVAVATDVAGGTLDRRLPDDPDLRPLVTAFNTMVGALQTRIERDARFASDVTHELRSPLTTIGASIELLESHRTSLPEGALLALRTLHLEVGRFSTMVEELLEMAGVDAGAQELHVTDVPIVELVERTVARHDRGVRVDLDGDLAGAHVRGDKRRLRQVLVNLLENAGTHGGGVVRVHVRREGAVVVVAVEDAGPGIAPEERLRVFERFYRGPASGKRGETGGSGLGLALVWEHVGLHGGEVAVRDSAAGGARVEVRLPLEAP